MAGSVDWTEITIKVLREAVPSLATLLAAFFGAWFAYRLQDKVKARDERATNIASANRALFTVFQQINSLRLFQQDMIDPHRDNRGMFIAMQPLLPESFAESGFDFHSLIFLFRGKHKQVILDLYIEQQRYVTAIKVINYRSLLYVQQVQPAFVNAGIREGIDYPAEAFAQALGPLLFKTLQRATEQVVYHVDRTVGSLGEVKSKMIRAFKELYPEGDFLNFELVQEPANQPLHGMASSAGAPPATP